MGLDLLLHANWPSYGEASLQSVDLSLKVSEGVMSPGTRSWSRTESAGITPTQLVDKENNTDYIIIQYLDTGESFFGLIAVCEGFLCKIL